MKDKLIYLTYQSFPSLKANTIQTIDNLNYLSKYFEIELIFPLRDENSSDDMNVLKNYYNINKNIEVRSLYYLHHNINRYKSSNTSNNCCKQRLI